MSSGTQAVDITVMICTWNNCAELERTLAALRDCQVPAGRSHEIVVVNNNSTDATDAVVEKFQPCLPLKLVHEPRPGLACARNRGLDEARGALIVFTDDDVRPSLAWLKAYWAAYERAPNCFLGGRVISRYVDGSPDPRLARFAPPSVTGYDIGPESRLLSDKESFIGPNWACPRALLDRVGKFDETRGLNPSLGGTKVGEETNLMHRLRASGAAGLYVPEAALEHVVPGSKSRLGHIARRAGAAAYDAAIDSQSRDVVPRVFGYPRWLVRQLCEAMWAVIWRFATFSDWVEPYVRIHQIVGFMRADRDARSMVKAVEPQ
jgi:glycosyltransferase involved in cell wall biosynthesis